jgi:Flp pilus assembly protein TadG
MKYRQRIKYFGRSGNRPYAMQKRGRVGGRARAVAIVEFAVVLPLLLTILFGIIEYGWVFMVRQTLQTAAREGARLAVLQTSTAPYTNVTDRISQVMGPTGLTTYSVTMTHATSGNSIETVEVSIPYNDVSLMGGFFGTHNYDLAGSCSMRKEGSTGSG